MAELPDLANNAFQGVMKQGGKKLLDQVLARFKESAPEWALQLKQAQSLGEAQRPAQVLKKGCSELGMTALEDLCFCILEAKTLNEAKPFIAQVQTRLPRALAAMAKERVLL